MAPDDLGHYDEIIVDVLQSERFLEEMETLTVELMDKMAPNLASGTPQGEGGEEVTNGQVTN